MDSTNWEQIKKLFNATIDLPVTERAAVLETCDESLRREVENLLKANREADCFIVEPALIEIGLVRENETDFYIGQQIDAYRILEEIGAGGMGTVYLATRADESFEKRVAVKLIKRGMDTGAVLKRFVRERQILAQLEHPCIANLLDGGSTRDGLPYFVMEYVEGLPLTKFCDAHQFSIEERLGLFQKVCSAVSYAHQNLIVHRDIKPSNILVTESGEPKLLDFGVAKLLQPEWSLEATEATATAFRMMTPEYASPEQIRGLPITTASDVYSLGIVLYELLTGDRPFNVKNQLPEEVVKFVLTEEPVRPSSVVSSKSRVRSPESGLRSLKSQGAALESEAETLTYKGQRTKDSGQKTKDNGQIQTPKSKLRNPKSLKGDLDNLILKALRKEPERRYPSVQEFSEDIRRHLAGLPVSATSDTASYRFKKFVKRHRTSVLAGGLICLTLIAATVITAWQAVVARDERTRAEERFRQVRKLARTVLFDYHDRVEKFPGSTELREIMVKDALEYLDNLSSESGGDPELQRELAAAYQKVGDVQSNINAGTVGNVRGALESFQKALKIRQTLAAENPANSEDLFALAVIYGRVGDSVGVFDEAARLENYRQALKIYENLSLQAPSEAKFRNGLAQGFFDLAAGLKTIRENGEAIENYRKAISIWEDLLAGESSNQEYRRSLALGYKRLGEVFDLQGEHTLSIEICRRALALDEERLKAFPDDSQVKMDLSFSYGAIGYSLMKTGDLENASGYLEKALELRLEVAKADPKRVRGSLSRAYDRLGELADLRGDFKGALANFQRSLALCEEMIANDPSDHSVKVLLAQTLEKLGAAYQKSAVQNNNQEFRRQACGQFQKAAGTWERIAAEKELLPWQKAASEKVKQKAAQCEKK